MITKVQWKNRYSVTMCEKNKIPQDRARFYLYNKWSCHCKACKAINSWYDN